MDIFEISLRELSEYVTAFQMLPVLKAKREEVFESFYHDCTSILVDGELGYLRTISYTVEDATDWIIEKKRQYDNLMQRYERKSRMLETALQSHTILERETFFTHYPSKTLNEKVCNSLQIQQIEYFKRQNRLKKQKNIEQVKDFISV